MPASPYSVSRAQWDAILDPSALAAKIPYSESIQSVLDESDPIDSTAPEFLVQTDANQYSFEVPAVSFVADAMPTRVSAMPAEHEGGISSGGVPVPPLTLSAVKMRAVIDSDALANAFGASETVTTLILSPYDDLTYMVAGKSHQAIVRLGMRSSPTPMPEFFVESIQVAKRSLEKAQLSEFRYSAVSTFPVSLSRFQSISSASDELNLRLELFQRDCSDEAARFADSLAGIREHFNLSVEELKPVENQSFVRDVKFLTAVPSYPGLPGRLPSVSANCVMDVAYASNAISVISKTIEKVAVGKSSSQVENECAQKLQEFSASHAGTVLNAKLSEFKISNGIFRKPTYGCNLNYLEVTKF